MKKKIIRITESDIHRMVANTVRRLMESGEEDPRYFDPDIFDEDPLVESEEESTVDVVVYLDSGKVIDGLEYYGEELPPNAMLIAVRPKLYPNVEDDGQVYSMDFDGVRYISPEYPKDQERLKQNYSRIMQILDDNFYEIAKLVSEKSDYVRY